ncbi:MAG: rhodanese-like domain-containing protein [Candidatus Lokiarchaeota archaeon]|nr:rhodanese-like domain-containing protein [Candidatus Lokiarchaeota archaeon]MCK4480606.1 rhodanese-like domain-containing protein [Candidatus Lokiarchaeota archaeon]
MKSIRKNLFKIFIFIILIFLPLNFQESLVTVKAQSYTDISVHEAYAMINDSILYPNLIVLDVRGQSEYTVNHICYAILIPLSEIESRITELEPYNDTEIIVYCLSGGRSSSASQILVNNGFIKIYNMRGGISEWISADYEICPTDSGESPSTIAFSFTIFLVMFLGVSLIITIFLKKNINIKIKKNS